MVLTISQFITGASYSSGTFSIPWTSINTALTTAPDITAADDASKFVYALLEILKEKNDAATLGQKDCAMEVTQKSVSSGGIWETSSNTFSNRNICSFLVSFPLTSVSSEDGNNIG